MGREPTKKELDERTEALLRLRFHVCGTLEELQSYGWFRQMALDQLMREPASEPLPPEPGVPDTAPPADLHDELTPNDGTSSMDLLPRPIESGSLKSRSRGEPEVPRIQLEQIKADLEAQGKPHGYKSIAKEAGVSESTVRRRFGKIP